MILLDFPLWIGLTTDVLTPRAIVPHPPGKDNEPCPWPHFRRRSHCSIQATADCARAALHHRGEVQGVPQHAVAPHTWRIAKPFCLLAPRV